MAGENLLGRFGVQLEESKNAGKPLSWHDCEDLEIYDDTGELLYAGPRYFRCSRHECSHLVTHGMVRQGGCWCGNRRLVVALRLTTEEKSLLKRGYYPLCQWEAEVIQVVLPTDKEHGWGRQVWEKKYA